MTTAAGEANPYINKSWFDDRLLDMGKTQRDLAQALGITNSAVSLMLKGTRPVRLEYLAPMVKFFNVSLKVLLFRCGLPKEAIDVFDTSK